MSGLDSEALAEHESIHIRDKELAQEETLYKEEWIISKSSLFYKVFRALKIVILIATFELYSYLAAFRFWDINRYGVWLSDVFELFFLVDMILKFFLEYTPSYSRTPVRNLRLTSQHYIETQFFWDFVALMPLQKLTLTDHRDRLFYLLKQVRMIDLIRTYDRRAVEKYIGEKMYHSLNWLYGIKENEQKPFKFIFNIQEAREF